MTDLENELEDLRSKFQDTTRPLEERKSFFEKFNSLVDSFLGFSKTGFKRVTKIDYAKRNEICQSCVYWNFAGMAGTGKCGKCGCSTQIKLRMATEFCPIGKWESVDISDK